MAYALDSSTDPWRFTSGGAPRGYIQPQSLSELWFHTGTACNLRCPFCLEGSKPGDGRLEQISFAEAKPFIDEALELGVEQFSFTGGEPFVNKDILEILAYALERRPVLVLTNGTRPLRTRLGRVAALRGAPHPLRFRISFDYPDAARHDVNRGEGNFAYAMETMRLLHEAGFGISVARQMTGDEDGEAVDAAYRVCFVHMGVPEDTHIVAFPDFLTPGAHPDGVPEITEQCMTAHQDEASRGAFMCAFSKMVVKREGRMRVYACTLVDDDPDYDFGGSLGEAMAARVMLRHHRCYSCFSCGASCSE